MVIIKIFSSFFFIALALLVSQWLRFKNKKQEFYFFILNKMGGGRDRKGHIKKEERESEDFKYIYTHIYTTIDFYK